MSELLKQDQRDEGYYRIFLVSDDIGYNTVRTFVVHNLPLLEKYLSLGYLPVFFLRFGLSCRIEQFHLQLGSYLLKGNTAIVPFHWF